MKTIDRMLYKVRHQKKKAEPIVCHFDMCGYNDELGKYWIGYKTKDQKHSIHYYNTIEELKTAFDEVKAKLRAEYNADVLIINEPVLKGDTYVLDRNFQEYTPTFFGAMVEAFTH